MRIKHTMTKRSLNQIEKITGERLTLGRLIWAIRMADAISQVEFAAKLGISRQHLCDIEHNRKAISPARAKEYAKKLKYPIDQFIRLSLQDLVDREGLNVMVDIKPNKSGRDGYTSDFAYA